MTKRVTFTYKKIKEKGYSGVQDMVVEQQTRDTRYGEGGVNHEKDGDGIGGMVVDLFRMSYVNLNRSIFMFCVGSHAWIWWVYYADLMHEFWH